MLVVKSEILFFLFFINALLFAQSKTNLEVFNNLVDSSANAVFNNANEQSISYKILNKTIPEYSALNVRAENSLIRAGIKADNNNLDNKIIYSILRATVLYTELFKDGVFGGYLMERKFILSGEYQINVLSSTLNADTFHYTLTDTISYDNIDFIENNSLPFTKSKLPDEPFFPSLLEPVIAITAVAVTVILFFSVRSN